MLNDVEGPFLPKCLLIFEKKKLGVLHFEDKISGKWESVFGRRREIL